MTQPTNRARVDATAVGRDQMTDELVTIRTYSSEMDATMAQQILEQSEISSVVSADDAGGMEPQLQASMGVRLIVNRADAERATEMLSTLEDDAPDFVLE